MRSSRDARVCTKSIRVITTEGEGSGSDLVVRVELEVKDGNRCERYSTSYGVSERGKGKLVWVNWEDRLTSSSIPMYRREPILRHLRSTLPHVDLFAPTFCHPALTH